LAFVRRIVFNPKIDFLGIEHREVGLEICRVAIEHYPSEDNYLERYLTNKGGNICPQKPKYFLLEGYDILVDGRQYFWRTAV